MKPTDMDEVYRRLPVEKIPWHITKPPKLLLDLIDSGKVSPCRVVDLGCGTGNYSVYLAGQGFEATGIDISPTAVNIASEKAREKQSRAEFISMDMTGDITDFDRRFDFAFEWEVLHHIFPESRTKYVENVAGLLNYGGKYFTMCFSEDDPHFGGKGKYRETPIGTVLYFSSERELRDLFEPHFRILEMRTVEVEGKRSPHMAVYSFMEKK